ncbi:putative membrane protein YeiB [Escherichia coli]|nr:putative membrane protein YeiB [Escherichia coli]
MAAGLGVSLVCLLTSNAAGTECAVSGDWLCVAVYGFWPQLSRFKLVLAIACVGRMALTNYSIANADLYHAFLPPRFVYAFDRLELLAFVISGMAGEYPLLCYLAALLPPGAGGMALASVTLRAAGPAISKTSR